MEEAYVDDKANYNDNLDGKEANWWTDMLKDSMKIHTS
jgi:hypothetical protein